MKQFVEGATFPWRALTLIRHTPRIWEYIVIPFFVNMVVGTLLYIGLLFTGLRGIDTLLAGLSGWAEPLRLLLQILLVLLLLFVIAFVLVRFGVVLGSPWYGQMSEKIEHTLTGMAPPAEPLTARGITRDIGRALLFELKKLGILALIIPLLFFNVVPLIGQLIITVGSISIGATIACLDFFDGPLERRRWRFRQKLGFVRQHFPASAGFGLICFGLISTPFINLLSIPLCVVAGTLFFCDRVAPSGPPPQGPDNAQQQVQKTTSSQR